MTLYTTGKIYERGEIAQGQSQAGNIWQRMTLVLDVPVGNYTKKMAFQVSTGNIPAVMALNLGDRVEVGWDVSSREWTNKEGKTSWFTSIDLRTIRLADDVPAQSIASTPIAEAGMSQEDDLPFGE
jgi:hypothetical protein